MDGATGMAAGWRCLSKQGPAGRQRPRLLLVLVLLRAVKCSNDTS